MEGELKMFEAEDRGNEQFLRKFLAPKRLGIKLNAPVMLLRNLNERHVNGLIGKVAKINKDPIDVKFETFGKSEMVRIEKFCFTKYDPATNTCIASRLQFPLKLAFAMTMDKSKGHSDLWKSTAKRKFSWSSRSGCRPCQNIGRPESH